MSLVVVVVVVVVLTSSGGGACSSGLGTRQKTLSVLALCVRGSSWQLDESCGGGGSELPGGDSTAIRQNARSELVITSGIRSPKYCDTQRWWRSTTRTMSVYAAHPSNAQPRANRIGR